MGLPPYQLEEIPQPNGTILRRGRGKAAGFALEWEEKPYEWIHGRHFRQARVFSKGPFRRFGPVFDLEAAVESLAATARTLQLAREQYEGEVERLRVGSSTVFQVDTLRRDLLGANRNHLNARIDVFVANAVLDVARGRFAKALVAPKGQP